MKRLLTAIVAATTLAAPASAALAADSSRAQGALVVSAAANLRPTYVTSPEPGYIVYAGYAGALPAPTCYWTRNPIYDSDRTVIGWRGRPLAVCP